MSPPIKFCLVCLSQEAISDFSESFIEHFIHWEKYLCCTTFVSDSPFYEAVAIPNENHKDQSRQEFLIPSRYVVWVSVGQDETIWGFGKPTERQSS
jgi:hypothetical protein